MDFKLTEEQRALKQEFEDFFREEMKDAPETTGGLEAMLASEESWKFHRTLGKKLGEKGWLSRPWPKAYGWCEAPIVEQPLFNEVRATAFKAGDHYIVNGQKIWTTGAHFADHIFLLLRTDSASKRNAGLSVFYCRKDLPGIEVRPIKYMNGKHVYNEIFLTDVKIPEANRIGQEGEGWKRLKRPRSSFIMTSPTGKNCSQPLR